MTAANVQLCRTSPDLVRRSTIGAGGQRHSDSERYVSAFWAKVDRSGGFWACWPWTAARGSGGYGRGYFGSTTYAHRRAWQLTNGPIPAGLEICHGCDNPPCCNPAHLWLGTHRENFREASAKGRLSLNKCHGEASPRAKLTASQVFAIRKRLAAGESQRTIARAFGVSQIAVYFIKSGRTWRRLA